MKKGVFQVLHNAMGWACSAQTIAALQRCMVQHYGEGGVGGVKFPEKNVM